MTSLIRVNDFEFDGDMTVTFATWLQVRRNVIILTDTILTAYHDYSASSAASTFRLDGAGSQLRKILKRQVHLPCVAAGCKQHIQSRVWSSYLTAVSQTLRMRVYNACHHTCSRATRGTNANLKRRGRDVPDNKQAHASVAIRSRRKQMTGMY